MLFATVGQGWVFLWMVAAGALIGAWYALLAALRRLLRAGFWLSLAADIAFGVGAAALFCGALVTANYGRPWPYTVFGALLGFALFAGAAFAPARRAAVALKQTFRHICVKIKEYRWIKVIFK